MPLTVDSEKQQVHITLPPTHDQSVSATVALYGATVISWKSAGGYQRLFLSEKAKLDGSAAIRGGIPIVFPLFGPASDHDDNHGVEKVPRHGVARTAMWKLDEADAADAADQADGSVTATFVLTSSDLPKVKDVYQWPFKLVYQVTLTKDSLTTTLNIHHLPSSSTSSSSTATIAPPMRFHALFHNYLTVPSSLTASISGLTGQSYSDKTADPPGSTRSLSAQSDPIVPNGDEWDAVFHGPASESILLSYNASEEENDSLSSASASASASALKVTQSQTLPNTTVWNPAKVKSDEMGDMQSDGWKRFVCIEPGKVRGFQELPAGQTFVASQTLTAL